MVGLIWGITTLVSESANLLQGLNNYTEKAYIKIQEIMSNLDISKIKLSNELLTIIQNSSQEILNSIYAFGTKALSNTVNIVPLELIIEPLTPVALDNPI